MNESSNTKKSLILQAARLIGAQKWTPAEIDQLRRRLIAEHGEAGKTGSEYIADVLEAAGLKLELTLQEEAEDQYEEEFEDLLHFKTLEDAEVSVMRLDELMRKFRSQGEHAAVERVLNVARLGKRRAEMISRNQKVEAPKRAEKLEIANWFRIWLETPDAFFDWLDVRKQSPDFQEQFPQTESEVWAPLANLPSIPARWSCHRFPSMWKLSTSVPMSKPSALSSSKPKVASRCAAKMQLLFGPRFFRLWPPMNFLSSISLAISIASANSASFTIFTTVKLPSAAWCFRSPAKHSSKSSSNALRVRLSACAPAVRDKAEMPSSRKSCRAAASTPINPHMLAMPSALFASRKTAGPRYSVKRSGPPRSSVAFGLHCKNLTSTLRGLIERYLRLRRNDAHFHGC